MIYLETQPIPVAVCPGLRRLPGNHFTSDWCLQSLDRPCLQQPSASPPSAAPWFSTYPGRTTRVVLRQAPERRTGRPGCLQTLRSSDMGAPQRQELQQYSQL